MRPIAELDVDRSANDDAGPRQVVRRLIETIVLSMRRRARADEADVRYCERGCSASGQRPSITVLLCATLLGMYDPKIGPL